MRVHGKIESIDRKIGRTRIKDDGSKEEMEPKQLISVRIHHTSFLTVPLSMKNVGQLWDIVQGQYPNIETEQCMKVSDAANFLVDFTKEHEVEIDVNLEERTLNGTDIYTTAKFLSEG